MSIRAYVITEFEIDERPSFNLTHDREIMELLGCEIYHQLGDTCSGYFELGKSDLKAARKKAQDERTVEIIDALLKTMGKGVWLRLLAS